MPDLHSVAFPNPMERSKAKSDDKQERKPNNLKDEKRPDEIPSVSFLDSITISQLNYSLSKYRPASGKNKEEASDVKDTATFSVPDVLSTLQDKITSAHLSTNKKALTKTNSEAKTDKKSRDEGLKFSLPEIPSLSFPDSLDISKLKSSLSNSLIIGKDKEETLDDTDAHVTTNAFSIDDVLSAVKDKISLVLPLQIEDVSDSISMGHNHDIQDEATTAALGASAMGFLLGLALEANLASHQINLNMPVVIPPLVLTVFIGRGAFVACNRDTIVSNVVREFLVTVTKSTSTRLQEFIKSSTDASVALISDTMEKNVVELGMKDESIHVTNKEDGNNHAESVESLKAFFGHVADASKEAYEKTIEIVGDNLKQKIDKVSK